MKKFLVEFKRIEYIHFYIEANNKKEVKFVIKNANWDLDSENIDEIENKSFWIDEVKDEY